MSSITEFLVREQMVGENLKIIITKDQRGEGRVSVDEGVSSRALFGPYRSRSDSAKVPWKG